MLGRKSATDTDPGNRSDREMSDEDAWYVLDTYQI